MAYDKINVPAGEKIAMEGGALRVPENPIIPFIEGDGTGPDITRAAISCSFFPTTGRGACGSTWRSTGGRSSATSASSST